MHVEVNVTFLLPCIQAPPPKKKKKLKPMPITDSEAETSGAGGSGAASEVEIVFKLHPKMNEQKELVAPIKDMSTRLVTCSLMKAILISFASYLSSSCNILPSHRRFIKTTTTALVEHLSKYLAMRISLELFPSSSSAGSGGDSAAASGSVKDLKIFIAPTPGQKVELSGSMSLTEANEKYWKVNKPMEMFYSFQRS